MSEEKPICIVCGRPIEGEPVKCSVCGAPMHRGCVDEEVLTDANGDPLCPYDAALAALDWLDSVVTQYAHSIPREKREELAERMKRLASLLAEEG